MIRVDPHTFRDRIIHMRYCMKPPLGFSLHQHTISEYHQMTCWFDRPENCCDDAGFAVTELGELVNLFCIKQTHGDRLVQEAIKRGAVKLDCYEGHLSELYHRHGFREVGRMEWDKRYAHPFWIEEQYGTPAVVFMELPTLIV